LKPSNHFLIFTQTEMEEKEVDFEELYIKMKEEKEKLEIENEKLRNQLQSFQKSKIGNKIKLNIGGKLFTTSLSTLTSEKNTFFTSMFGETFNTQPDDDGEFFIDRSPQYFQIILDYLRNPTKELDLSDLNEKQLKEFFYEVDFYSIKSLHFVPQKVNEILGIGDKLSIKKLDTNKFRISKSNSGKWDANITFSSCKKWKITCIQNCFSLAVGVIDKKLVNVNALNSFNGYFIYSNGGTLYSKDGNNCDPYAKSFYSSGQVSQITFEDGELKFSMNGKSYGAAFKGLPDDLVPSFDVGSSSACFDIEFCHK
jgi:hypothetical protein